MVPYTVLGVVLFWHSNFWHNNFRHVLSLPLQFLFLFDLKLFKLIFFHHF